MNKKSLFILLICLGIFAVCACCLTACSNNKLVSPRNLRIDDGIVTWDAVNGADAYLVYMNDNETERVLCWDNKESIYAQGLGTELINGVNQFWVCGIKLDKYGFPSEYSDRSRLDFLVEKKLPTPENVELNKDGTKISWDSVLEAKKYIARARLEDTDVYKDYEIKWDINQITQVVSGEIQNMPNGRYSVSIVAVYDDVNKKFADSDPSESITFVQTGSLQGDAVADDGWVVTFDMNCEGKDSIIQKAQDEKAVARPEDPTRPGFKFDGWYFDSYCLIPAYFSSTRSTFKITANTTLYAGWKAEQVLYKQIYFYSEEWTTVKAKPFLDDNALFEGDGVQMRSYDGAQNWFKASINAEATKVIFTNGEVEIDSGLFEGTKCYFMNGVWTLEMPKKEESNPDIGQYLLVNGSKHNLVENEDTDKTDGRLKEYMITLNLAVGDVVTLVDSNNYEYVNYEPGCPFDGVAKIAGEYTFFVKTYPSGDAIWVTVPEKTDSTGGLVIYYYNANNWSTVNAYAWAGSGNPCNAAWPGKPMKAVQGHDGWYSIEVDTALENIIFNNGTAQTKDLEIDTTNTYFDGKGWTNDFVEAKIETVKIYFYKSSDWAGVNAYYWTNGEEIKWPGTKMKQEGNSNWYYIEIDASFTYIIFNNLAYPDNKTDDLVIPSGSDVLYYKNGEWVSSKD